MDSLTKLQVLNELKLSSFDSNSGAAAIAVKAGKFGVFDCGPQNSSHS